MSPRETPRSHPANDTEDATASAHQPASETGTPSRKPYHAPRLVVYGRLTEITRFGGSEVVDSGSNLGSLQ